jgi:hypothetical protein
MDNSQSSTELYLQTGNDPRLDADPISIIRSIEVNDAVQDGLMQKWLDLMVGGLMSKVSANWKMADPGKDLLSTVTTANDEAFLYYVMSHVGWGENWTPCFAAAGELISQNTTEPYQDIHAARAAIRTILQRSNMTRVKSYAFCQKNVFKHMAPIVQNIHLGRLTPQGRAWDEHLRTMVIGKRANSTTDGGQSERADSAQKKLEERLKDKNKYANMLEA